MVTVSTDYFPVMTFLNGKANPGFSLNALSLTEVRTEITSSRWLAARPVLMIHTKAGGVGTLTFLPPR